MTLDRRTWLLSTSLAAVAWNPFARNQGLRVLAQDNQTAMHLGTRRELLVDDALLADMAGMNFRMHRPVPMEVAITCDQPWEGNTSAYYSIFQDEDRYRMYYRGSHFDEKTKTMTHPEVACLAESKDGIHWEKPHLGLHAFNGSMRNNIVHLGEGTHNFTPFKDTNPACAAEARYKALASATRRHEGKSKQCLHAYQSADGVRWSKMAEAVITEGAFDSQNVAFWDAERGHYRAYWRFFTQGVRAIRTATSMDFLRWENQSDLQYVDSPTEHLYTNAVSPYFRAPHLLVGFPTRFQPKTQQVEPVFMSSRDGVLFRRSAEELIPITAPKDRDGNRSNYMTHGLLALASSDRELSVYASEAYYAGPGSRLRRFTFRVDGFMSLNSPKRAIATSHPLTFQGTRLVVNIVSRKGTRIGLLGADGQPLPGHALNDCQVIEGDFIDREVKWNGQGSLTQLANQPIRIQFELDDADLYSFQFQT